MLLTASAPLRIAALTLAVLAAPALFAQSADQPAAEDPTTQPPADAAEGEGAAAEPEVTVTEYGDWEVRCGAEAGNCAMAYLARDQNDNPVADIRIVALPEGEEAEAGVTVVTPLGTVLSNGLLVRIDGQRQLQFPFTFCSRSGCFARFGLDEGGLNGFKRGAEAVFLLASVNTPDQVVQLPMSLRGFTAAFDALRAALAEAGAEAGEAAGE